MIMRDEFTQPCRYVTDIRRLERVGPVDKLRLQKVSDRFPFRSNDYYLSLIDWEDPHDPIRRIVLPDVQELREGGDLDPSDEHSYTVLPGLEHKYDSTVLVLVSNDCDSICRYCFRKRVFLEPRKDYLTDLDAMEQYIRSHTEVSNVLLTGGDPLMLDPDRLDEVIGRIHRIDHVRMIRIGTKVPVFNPPRILRDSRWRDVIARWCRPDKKLYIMTHYMHPRELTDVASRAIHEMQNAGAIINNQCPIIRGVNDDPDVLAELWRNLSAKGVMPYYVFQCRPTIGNADYAVPIEQGYRIVELAKEQVSGLAKRVRFVMSHSTGKMEILALTGSHILLRYHRAADNGDSGRILMYRRNPRACWLDDYGRPIHVYNPLHEGPKTESGVLGRHAG